MRRKKTAQARAAFLNRQIKTGFYDVQRGNTIVGTMRSCLQDGIIMIAQKLQIEGINRDSVYKACPPSATHDTSLQELLDCEVIGSNMKFKFENYRQLKGGPSYALLKVKTGPPRLVLADFPDVDEKHAFMYDAVEGYIMDNRKEGKKRFIETSDRSTIKRARHCINSFFNSSRVDIRCVYSCTAK